MWNQLKNSLSCEGETSNMRVLTTICVFFAILIGLVAVTIWVLSFFLDKNVTELGLVIGLCGTFLAPLLPKAIQSFAEAKEPPKVTPGE